LQKVSDNIGVHLCIDIRETQNIDLKA